MDDIYGRINARDEEKGRGKRIRMGGEEVIYHHHIYPGFPALNTVILRLSRVSTRHGGGDDVAAR